jgi:hypothetical protein
VPTPALSKGGYLMTTAWAFDAREILPPFFPVFRCEDNLYGDLLAWFRPHDWIGHMPQSLVHAPEEARCYVDETLVRRRAPLPLAAIAALLMEDASVEGATPGARMREMARHLVAIAGSRHLEAVIKAKVAESVRERIRYVRQCREVHAESPAWWHRDLELHAFALGSITTSHPVLPTEVSSFDDLRHLLRAYGEVLGSWPELWAGARELRALERGPASPL